LVELHQCAYQIGRAGLLRSIGVGFVFMFARIGITERLGEKDEARYGQYKEQQRCRSAAIVYAQPLVKPRLLRKICQAGQEYQTDGKHQHATLDDMVALEMAKLMRKYRFDLSGGKTQQQGIEKDDSLRGAEAGE